MTRDFSGLIRTIGEETKAYLAPFIASLSSITQRVAELEVRAPVPGPAGRDGTDGKNAEFSLTDLTSLMGDLVVTHLEAHPPKSGRDGIDGKDGQDGVDGLPGAPGRDGADGAVGSVGPQGEKGLDGVHGKDGRDGIDGKDGLAGIAGRDGLPGRDGLAGALGEKGLDGKDGRDGTNGLDGFGFDDLDVTHDGERGFTFRFTKGERVKGFSFALPVLIFRGVFEESKAYERGDVVQFGGHLYHAKTATSIRPSELTDGMKDWTLMVRRGRDGKQGPQGAPGNDGKPGGPR